MTHRGNNPNGTYCGYEFCWLCLGDWYNHRHCGGQPPADANASESRASIKRALHYSSRYEEHRESRKLEEELRNRTMREINAYFRTHSSTEARKLKYLLDAVEALIYCRQTLQYTYVTAYVLKDDTQEKSLFEFLQGQLESKTEDLAFELEKEIDIANRSKIKNLTLNSLQRLHQLLDGVEHGLTSDPDSFKLVDEDGGGESRGRGGGGIASLFRRR